MLNIKAKMMEDEMKMSTKSLKHLLPFKYRNILNYQALSFVGVLAKPQSIPDIKIVQRIKIWLTINKLRMHALFGFGSVVRPNKGFVFLLRKNEPLAILCLYLGAFMKVAQ